MDVTGAERLDHCRCRQGGHDGTPIRRYKAAMSSEKADPQIPFWRRKAMSEMTRAEWESLCDGCGRCCLNKLIDEDTNATVFTDVSCKLLDCQSCRCSDYAHRRSEEHTSELQSRRDLVCRLLLEKKKNNNLNYI